MKTTTHTQPGATRPLTLRLTIEATYSVAEGDERQLRANLNDFAHNASSHGLFTQGTEEDTALEDVKSKVEDLAALSGTDQARIEALTKALETLNHAVDNAGKEGTQGNLARAQDKARELLYAEGQP